MKCPQCRTEMNSRRENHRYVESGLANVVLVDVEKRTCPSCGETSLAIPRMGPLHKAIAMALIGQEEKFSPQEVKFLRKWMGWSGIDFSKHMGVDSATVSRWERVDDPQVMGTSAERLLRMCVATQEPDRNYMNELAELHEKEGRSPLRRFRVSDGKWRESVEAIAAQ